MTRFSSVHKHRDNRPGAPDPGRCPSVRALQGEAVMNSYTISTKRGYWYVEKDGLAMYCALSKKACKQWIDEHRAEGV